MARKTKEVLTKAGFIFKIIWLAVASFLFFMGLTMFLQTKDFGSWMLWGAVCIIPIIGDIIRTIVSNTKKESAKGSREYTATVSSSGVSVKNNSFRNGLMSLVASIIISLLVGPIFLGIKMLTAVIEILSFVIALISTKNKNASNNGNEIR